MKKSELEKFRSRWRRWLGQKTRIDKPYWITLLDINFCGWANQVRMDAGLDYVHLGPFSADRKLVKSIFLEAINHATMKQLLDLDELYLIEKYNY
jgi:hypothetical protein